MSSIGSGPGIGAGPQLEVNPVRPVNPLGAVSPVGGGAVAGSRFGVQTGASGGALPPAPATAPVTSGAQAQATIVSTSAASAGSPPVDLDRVAAIRKAIQNGSYPLVPTKIGDAMIAAGMILRIPK